MTKATDPAGAVDPDLHQLIDAWPNLPAPIRRAMLAVLEAGK